MAQNKTVDIVDIQVNYQDAIRAISTYRENLRKLQQDQQKLKDDLLNNIISQKEYDKASAATTINIKNQQQAISTLEKQVLTQIKAEQAQTQSITALRAALADLTQKYADMSKAERESAAGKALGKNISDLSKELNEATAKLKEFQKNTGTPFPVDSIKGLRDELKKARNEYNALTEAERNAAKGNTLQNKIAALSAQIKNLQDSERAMAREMLNTMREQERKEGSLNQLRAALSNATKAYDDMSRAERNGAAGKDMLKHINEITNELKRAEEESQRYYRNVGNYPSAFKGFGGIISKVGGLTLGISGLASAGTMLVGALKEGVNTAMDFEKANSSLAAVLGVSKDGMSGLTEQARELGATTRYTATEVTQLQTELAKLGYSQQDIQNMTKDVLAFAQATGSELADAASLTGATLRMFGDDTTHTQEYVDKMAAACTNSALDFSYLATAMSTVGPVANSFGFKIEDVLSLLGQLSNAGFDASSAATATRNILLNLADANGDLAKSLGAPVTDLKGLTDGLRKLQSQGIKLSESLQLTDARSVAAFNTFLETADGADKLKETLNGANGAAEEMAKTMGDNLEGDIASLGSAWDDFMIELNNGQSIFRTIVQWLTEIVRAASEMYQEVRSYFVDLYNESAIFRGAVIAIGTSFTNMWSTVKLILNHFMGQLKATGKILKGILTLDWDTFAGGLKDFASVTLGTIKTMVKETAGGVTEVVNKVLDATTTTAKAGTPTKVPKINAKDNTTPQEEGSTETQTSSSGNGLGLKTDKQRKAEEAAANKAASERRKREDVELKAVQEYNTQLLKLMGQGLEARRAQTAAAYDGEIARLEKQLHQKQNLTATAEEAIRKTIELKRKERDIAIQKLDEENIRKEIDKRVELLEAELNVTQSKTYERFNILRKIEQEENDKRISEYNTAQAEELQGIESGSQQALEIEERYNQLRELSRQQMWQNIHEIDREQQDALNANRQQILENELAELEIENSQKLELKRNLDQLGLDVVTEDEMKELQKRQELADLKLEQIREQGQQEGETYDEYRARELAAEKEKANASNAIDNATYKNKQAYTKAMESITNSLIGLTEQIGESNEAFAKMSKIITLAQIAIDTGKALSAGIASASSMPFPSNLAAIATTVATVLANVTTAISTVKAAKFAQGKVNIHGAGTGTSDSIPAQISNGESVINAKATKMFAPILEAMNAIGNGVPLPSPVSYQQSAMTVDMMSEAFKDAVQDIRPVVDVQEITTVQKRIEVIQNLDTY